MVVDGRFSVGLLPSHVTNPLYNFGVHIGLAKVTIKEKSGEVIGEKVLLTFKLPSTISVDGSNF